MKKLFIGAACIFAALFLWYITFRIDHKAPLEALITVFSIYTAAFIGFAVYYLVRSSRR